MVISGFTHCLVVIVISNKHDMRAKEPLFKKVTMCAGASCAVASCAVAASAVASSSRAFMLAVKI